MPQKYANILTNEEEVDQTVKGVHNKALMVYCFIRALLKISCFDSSLFPLLWTHTWWEGLWRTQEEDVKKQTDDVETEMSQRFMHLGLRFTAHSCTLCNYTVIESGSKGVNFCSDNLKSDHGPSLFCCAALVSCITNAKATGEGTKASIHKAACS